ncbi:hypothetical protein like AT4G32870 [Hibiscus trionum]|uniref:Lachrymatory factor synthase n=1 Tax=Hibiscus trionum TaxID=183268 RepID=A0A9W7HVF2_HIBTR|nr:hypothetical protein like AT4G32870 [Hibiscus trionum]
MADEGNPKWEGKATAELKASTAEQIWPLIAEFCNLDKFFPTVDICYRKEGSPGDGCKIEWTFVSDPIQGLKLEDLVSLIHDSLQFMAKKMEEAVQGQS